MEGLLSGVFTTEDYRIYDYMRLLKNSEDIFIEPSACAAFKGVMELENCHDGRAYIEKEGLTDKMENATHIAWATGGRMVPSDDREVFMNTYL